MKNKSSAQTNLESIQFHKNKERIDPFKIQFRAPGVDIPGFGKHYPCLIPKGPMTRSPASFIRDLGGHHDPCFWNRGGGRWFHSRRRGGQVGRQRERGLPRAPFPA
jgi:hypothetical protein